MNIEKNKISTSPTRRQKTAYYKSPFCVLSARVIVVNNTTSIRFVHIYTHKFTHMHVAHVHTHMEMYLHAHMHTHDHALVRSYTYAHSYTHMHVNGFRSIEYESGYAGWLG